MMELASSSESLANRTERSVPALMFLACPEPFMADFFLRCDISDFVSSSSSM